MEVARPMFAFGDCGTTRQTPLRKPTVARAIDTSLLARSYRLGVDEARFWMIVERTLVDPVGSDAARRDLAQVPQDLVGIERGGEPVDGLP
jgi:hypothetical protein